MSGFNGWPPPTWARVAARLEERGQDYVVFGPRPSYDEGLQHLIAGHGTLDGLDAALAAHRLFRDEERFVAGVEPRRYFSVRDALCPTLAGCAWHRGGDLLYADAQHLSRAGSLFLAEAFARWLGTHD